MTKRDIEIAYGYDTDLKQLEVLITIGTDYRSRYFFPCTEEEFNNITVHKKNGLERLMEEMANAPREKDFKRQPREQGSYERYNAPRSSKIDQG